MKTIQDKEGMIDVLCRTEFAEEEGYGGICAPGGCAVGIVELETGKCAVIGEAYYSSKQDWIADEMPNKIVMF